MKQHAGVRVCLIAALLVLPLVAQYAQAVPADEPDKQEVMAKLEKMSAELKLTPEQKKQMLPILMEEGKKMKALKADTTLGPLQKARSMKQIGDEVDAKVKPILSADQYTKFEQMRAQEREEMMQKMRSGKG
jgi:uncharacterized membrane protein YvbJ